VVGETGQVAGHYAGAATSRRTRAREASTGIVTPC
jgi:hypothetical protein